MIVKFLVDVDDGKTHIVAIACHAQWTLQRSITALRRRIALPNDAHVSIRLADGSPVPSERVMRSFASRNTVGTPQAAVLHALVDGVESHLIPQLKLRRRIVTDISDDDGTCSSSSEDGQITLADGSQPTVTTLGGGGPGVSSAPVVETTSGVHHHRRRRALGPAQQALRRELLSTSAAAEDEAATTATEDIVSYSSDISEEMERLVQGIGIHSIKVNHTYRKAYATKDTLLGDIVVREHPMITVAYPQQIVESVRSHEKLRGLSYDASFRAPSTIHGLDDDAFARYLSIGMTHGLRIATRTRFQTQVTFFPDITACRHSCAPNAVFVHVTDRPPYEGMLRCAVKSGIDAGDEVTYLYPHVDRREFVVLPRERREAWMQRIHYLKPDEYCGCSRCWKAAKDEREISITGAFFQDGATPAEREVNASAMRRAFDKLLLTPPSRKDVVMSLEDAIEAQQQCSSSASATAPHTGAPPTAAELLVRRYRFVCAHGKELLEFLAAYTRRVYTTTTTTQRSEVGGNGNRSVEMGHTLNSSGQQHGPLGLHILHWRLSLARLRLLDVFVWLFEHRVDARRAFTSLKRNQEQQQLSAGGSARNSRRRHPSANNAVAEGDDAAASNAPIIDLPPIPFCKGAFDAALDQMNAEAVLLPKGHPMALTSWQIWRRMMSQIPEKLAAGVQQRSLSSQWCPNVDWEALASMERVFNGPLMAPQ